MPSAIWSDSFCRSFMSCSTVSVATTPRSAPSSCSVVNCSIAPSWLRKRSAARRTNSGSEPIFTSATPDTLTVTPLDACAVGSILIWRARSEIISARCVSGFTSAPPPVITEMREDSPEAFFWLLPTTTSAWSAFATLYQARTMTSRKIRRMMAATTAIETITSVPPAAKMSTERTHFLVDVLRPYRVPRPSPPRSVGITPADMSASPPRLRA